MKKKKQKKPAPAPLFSGAVPVKQVMQQMASPGLGFERVKLIKGSTYADHSTVVIIPTRGMIHWRVAEAWQGLIGPPNTKRALFFAAGDEVGHAYNRMIENILKHPELKKWKYVLTLEDDNLPPPDAHVRLLETIEDYAFDAVSGLYWTKTPEGSSHAMSMCYGDPRSIKERGVVDFAPLDIRAALRDGQVAECNGIAMGTALWRMDLFREVAPPWFVTVADVIPNKGAQVFTQDLHFCHRARLAGKRFGVDTRVRVGHLNVADGVVY